ncbi:MAG: hypothetical protein JSV24_12335 [Bacteroidales bacterium]|nr:MAG: hypothetical protein JSV24_12335 [Bacteroidales bacterium]
MMKEDTLGKFIHENRDHFDVYDPDPALWKKIRPPVKISEPGRAIWRPILWRAAAVGIIFILSVIISELVLRDTGFFNRLTGGSGKEIRIPELQEAEIYYTSQLKTKYQEVSNYLKENPELENELIRDFTTLDSIYSELKEDLKDNISNREVVEALIQNYRIKLTILEDLLQHLENTEGVKNDENDRHEL